LSTAVVDRAISLLLSPGQRRHEHLFPLGARDRQSPIEHEERDSMDAQPGRQALVLTNGRKILLLFQRLLELEPVETDLLCDRYQFLVSTDMTTFDEMGAQQRLLRLPLPAFVPRELQ